MFKISAFNGQAALGSRPAENSKGTSPKPEPARKLADGILGGLETRNQTRAASDRPPVGLKKMMANQVFGSEADRRTVEPEQQTKIRVGVFAGQIDAVKIKGDAGVLEGHFYKANSGDKTGKVALLLSGSGGPAEMQAPDIADKYQKNGVDVLSVNYRGFGASEGTPNEQGLYQDANAMLNHLTHTMNVPAENVLIHGYSMGGPIAAHLATKARSEGHSVGGIILDRPMPSTSKGVRAHFPRLGGIPGQIAKQAAGTLSVEKNLRSQPAGTKIVMMTDSDRLGGQGELLRQRLVSSGFRVSGAQVAAAHDESAAVMESQFGAVKAAFLQPALTHPTHPPVAPARQETLPASEQEKFMEDFGYLRDYYIKVS